MWDDEPPETAQKAVQVYVSQLRKLLGKDRLETKPPGYRLHVDAGELDLDRFRGLVEQGCYDEALAHWRGPPLSDFASQRFAQAEIARLEELRVSCLEARIEQSSRKAATSVSSVSSRRSSANTRSASGCVAS